MYKYVKYYKNFDDLKNNSKHDNKSMYIIFITENLSLNLQVLLELNIKFHGAIFPKIIFENRVYCEGLLLIELDKTSEVLFYQNMNKVEFVGSEFKTCKSIMAIFDGFSKSCTNFVENIFENVKLDTTIFGGGAGFLKKDENNVIFSNRGVFKNSAFLVLSKEKAQLGVSHGWQYLEGPFIATKAEKNILYEIDYENAFDVYKRTVEEDCGVSLTKENFLDVSMQYPLGIIKFNGESLIRDPYTFNEDGSLFLASPINNNTIFNILKGEKKALIEASSQLCEKYINNTTNTLFMFECITRLEFLKESFNEEIEQILKTYKTKNINGVFSVGEIGNSGDRYIYILNKSSVLVDYGTK